MLSDAGSTPAASTTFPEEIDEIRSIFPPPPLSLHGQCGSWTVQQTNRRVERCRAQVHVALRRRQVLMARQFLNRFGWRVSHREMRAEGVSQDVDAGPRPS